MRMLRKYPLPANWSEEYDPGTGRFYYWHKDGRQVSWLSPNHPRAQIVMPADKLREVLTAGGKPSHWLGGSFFPGWLTGDRFKYSLPFPEDEDSESGSDDEDGEDAEDQKNSYRRNKPGAEPLRRCVLNTHSKIV